jgi:hypothetical protein
MAGSRPVPQRLPIRRRRRSPNAPPAPGRQDGSKPAFPHTGKESAVEVAISRQAGAIAYLPVQTGQQSGHHRTS